ncbi:MAG: hypothetical protein M3M89_03600, partial [Thermoproteota archaeon]|nr:hypothetical protein [Thermoproteota archaeon]
METCECDCECKSAKSHTPINIHNPAGLSTISYRIGTHAHFKSDMLAFIASKPSLSKLTTRNGSDLSIALIDGWATILDVLTFYQERIANEGFLRTASERMSVLELAREIGYKLKPGVAAGTYLAFTMDNTAGSPEKTIVSIGTKVQSIPSSQDEKPQTFETVEEIQTRSAWNEMKPLMTKDQDLYKALIEGKLIFAGTSTRLKSGDGILFVIDGKPVAFRVIDWSKVEAESQQTIAAFSTRPEIIRPTRKEKSETTISLNNNNRTTTRPTSVDAAVTIDNQSGFTKADLRYILSKIWTEKELQAQSELEAWSVDQIVHAINSERRKEQEEEDGGKKGHGNDDGVLVLRIKCSVFGNNAPRWSSLPSSYRYGSTIDGTKVEAIYTYNWDKGTDINTDSQGKSYGLGRLFLDNTYAGIAKESWLVLSDPDLYSVYQVISTTEKTLTEFSLNAKATGLTVERYLFRWEQIAQDPRNKYDESLLRDFLRGKLGLEWIDEETIFKKGDGGKLITAEAGHSNLSIMYDESNAVATLRINSYQGSSWSKWHKFSGIIKEVAVAVKQNGNPDVFIIGEDNSIHHRWFREHDLHWSGWDKLGEDAKSLAVIRNTDGKLQVFVTDGSSVIRTKKQTRADGNWQPWENLSAPNGIQQLAAAAAVLGSQAKIFLFALLQDGRVFYKSSPFETNGWKQVVTTDSGASAISVKRISAAAGKSGTIVLFFIATSGDVYVKDLLSSTETWGKSEKLGQLATAAADIAAIATAEDGSAGALFIGTDSNVYSISKSASGWSSFILIHAKDGTVEPAQIAAAVNKRGALEIFALNSFNNTLYHKWQLNPVQFVVRKNGNSGNTLVYENYLGNFDFRETLVYASPEKLDLARAVIEQSVEGMEIVLDRMVGHLKEGRPVFVSGELYDQPGIIKKEIAFISSIVHLEVDKVTTLK